MKKILIIEDDETSAMIMEQFLSKMDVEISLAETGYEALESIEGNEPDLILLDLGLPDIKGMDLIKKIREKTSISEIIIVTGEEAVESAVEAIRLGARDYLQKPVNKDRLQISVRNVFDRIELSRQIAEIKQNKDKRNGFQDFVGYSTAMQILYKAIENSAQSNERVFIVGENGSGRTLCAKTIHEMSERANEPFVEFNCLNVNNKNAPSKIDAALKEAGAGTLYIQYVTELCETGQAELLKIADSPITARIICSSIQDPTNSGEGSALREDLYYRLNVLPLNIPPLRKRGSDINLLAQYLLKKYSAEHDKNFKEFDDFSMKILNDYHWPGNVRELENIVKGIVTLNNDDDTIIRSAMLPPVLANIGPNAANENQDKVIGNIAELFETNEIYAIRDLERMAIEHALRVCDGNVQEAALRLKISPATLYRKKPAA